MKSFNEYCKIKLKFSENVLFGGYSKDGRIFLNVNGERKIIVLDAIMHDKIKKMEKENSDKAYDYLVKLVNSGDAYFL